MPMHLPKRPSGPLPGPLRGSTRLARLRIWAARQLLPRRVRMRLTLLYGLLFVASGAVLLGITYVLVNRPSSIYLYKRSPGSVPKQSSGGLHLCNSGEPCVSDPIAMERRQQAMEQHDLEMHHLLVQSGIALAIMSVIAVVLGWLVAGRVLRPLRTMTSTIQRISARNVHERLAVQGPGDELKDLADTVDGLLGRLETALDSHKRFVANAAHELRTPLTVEHALLEEALIDRGATVESFRSNFERLLDLSRQQARLLESLLTLSSSERGLDGQEPLDLSETAVQVVDGRRGHARERGLRLETDLTATAVWGDGALVERLLVNLLDNAVDYNVPGGWVQVSTGRRDDRCVVRVANSGREVPPDRVAHLFEPFQRLDRVAGDGHHGLGLSIVRSIATAHGATLSARARAGGGLVVEVSFPLRTALPPAGRWTPSYGHQLPDAAPGLR